MAGMNRYGKTTTQNQMTEKENGTTVYRNEEALERIAEVIPKAAGRPEARYFYDTSLSEGDGWLQFDTTQDAWYFGVWVNKDRLMTVTYAEGDVSLVECPTKDALSEEIREMVTFYGEAPPAFITYGEEGGQTVRTEYYDTRARRIGAHEEESE